MGAEEEEEKEKGAEICLEEDQCVLESSDEYLEEETKEETEL